MLSDEFGAPENPTVLTIMSFLVLLLTDKLCWAVSSNLPGQNEDNLSYFLTTGNESESIISNIL